MQNVKPITKSIPKLLSAYENKKKPRVPILLFENEIQKGYLYLPPTNAKIEHIAHPIEQRTLYVFAGTAVSSIDKQTQTLREGELLVIPPRKSCTFSQCRDFVGLAIVSPGSDPKKVQAIVNKLFPTASPKEGGKIFSTNLLDALKNGERKTFMDTPDGLPQVQEIEIFFPFDKNDYLLTPLQACRLLIYETTTVLNRHMHPYAQHAICVLEGEAVIEAAGEEWSLKPGELFIVPPQVKHKLGSRGNMVGFVINTPGIDPSDPNYEQHVEELTTPVIKRTG